MVQNHTNISNVETVSPKTINCYPFYENCKTQSFISHFKRSRDENHACLPIFESIREIIKNHEIKQFQVLVEKSGTDQNNFKYFKVFFFLS